MAPNGLELSCPAEAGNAARTLGQAGRQDKLLRRPSPPGQLQRVVRQRLVIVELDALSPLFHFPLVIGDTLLFGFPDAA